MAVLAIAFNACTDEYEYDAVTDTDNSGAYILTDTESPTINIVLTEEDAQEIKFSVARHDSTTAETYTLYTDNSEINIPSEISFAAGEAKKDVTATFNVPAGTIGMEITIGVGDGKAYTYGRHSQTYSINRLRKINGCVFYSYGIFADASGEVVPAYWDVDVYEYGFTKAKDGSTVASYLVNNPYEGSGLGEDAVGYSITFSIDNTGAITMNGRQGLFYCSASFSGSPAITGVVTASGSGLYVPGEGTIDGILKASNFILFTWNLPIGTSGYGFNATHALIFPDGYNPLTQTQATQE